MITVTIYNRAVYDAFCDEWVESSYNTWSQFIMHCNIGLQVIDELIHGDHNYCIVDLKQYLFAKIKYSL